MSHEKGWAGGGEMRLWKKLLVISDHKKGDSSLCGETMGQRSSDITLGNGSSRIYFTERVRWFFEKLLRERFIYKIKTDCQTHRDAIIDICFAHKPQTGTESKATLKGKHNRKKK